VWQLLSRSEPRSIGAAAVVALLATGCRGLRLSLLMPPGQLGAARATVLAAAAQAAAQFLPLRAGELALPWLLRRSSGRDLAAGVSTLLAARTLDLAALGVWTAAGVIVAWGVDRPLILAAGVAVLVPPVLLPRTLALADCLAVRTIGRRGVRGRRWARRVRRMRRAMDEMLDRPWRLAAAAAASLTMWAAVWAYTWLLLVAMGYRWPVGDVVAGSAFASLANLLPVNLVANLGTLEAGWTAAFVALGVPVETAAASGFAAHLWALVLIAVFGAAAWLVELLLPRCTEPAPGTLR
jgi:uncharacterized protein (TIRG00374 family)